MKKNNAVVLIHQVSGRIFFTTIKYLKKSKTFNAKLKWIKIDQCAKYNLKSDKVKWI